MCGVCGVCGVCVVWCVVWCVVCGVFVREGGGAVGGEEERERGREEEGKTLATRENVWDQTTDMQPSRQ